jgi:hypothetical protein
MRQGWGHNWYRWSFLVLQSFHLSMSRWQFVGGHKMHIFTATIPTFYSRYRRYVLITNEFYWSTISGTSDDGKAPYEPKSMHNFIMSKIRHSHRKYDTRKCRWTEHRLNRAKVWPAGHITLADRSCVGAFPKTVLSMCPSKAVLKVSNAQRRCKEETWPPGQVAWPADLTSGPHTPNLRWEHHLTPINTMVLPSVEGVKKVRLSPPPQGLPNSIFVE